MFTHILLPTDGSILSEDAIQQGVQFAKQINARVTGFHVSPEFRSMTLNAEMLEDTREVFEQHRAERAAQYLARIEQTASAAGVPCETVCKVSDAPYEAIVAMASEKGCDLIAMASHGRSGLKGILLGSVTQKVLAHTPLPVLVFR